VTLAEGWYLMSVRELEQELARSRGQDVPATASPKLTTEDALRHRDAGNIPDELGRSLRLVLHVRSMADVRELSKRRLEFEPDFHDEPSWRVADSVPVNVVPLRLGSLEPAAGREWWNEPGVAELDAEWAAEGTIGGIRVPESYRSFVYKTVLSLRAAGREVTVESVYASVSRWLSADDADSLRVALEEANAR
jgi:hypothetical protein